MAHGTLLSAALGTHPCFYFDMQSSYEYDQTKREKRPKIKPFGVAA
jgi:hypothetical protein